MKIIIDPEFKKLIPPLSESEFEGLEQSILKDGIRTPVDTWGGILVDGHNRYKIAKKHNLECPTRSIEFTDITQARIWIRKNQLSRRNLTDAWKIELELQNKAELMAIHEQERVERRKENVHVSNNDTRKATSGRTRETIANTLKMSTGKVAQAEYVKKNDPVIWEQAKAGDVSIGGAYKEVVKQKKKETLEEKKATYRESIETKVTEGIDIFNTDKKYRIIYADPPWSYNDKQDTPQLGGSIKHYSTMPIIEICSLPVSKIKESNAILFLWTTSPLLEDSFKVINSWGFKYKSSFIWDKISHSMGHYNSVRHEFLLICTKGSCTPDKKKLFDSVQSIEKTRKHSEKPIEFMDIIDELYEFGNRIELFARSKKKSNWDVWGNEV